MSEYANEKLLALDQLKAAVREYDEHTPLRYIKEQGSHSVTNFIKVNEGDLFSDVWGDIAASFRAIPGWNEDLENAFFSEGAPFEDLSRLAPFEGPYEPSSAIRQAGHGVRLSDYPIFDDIVINVVYPAMSPNPMPVTHMKTNLDYSYDEASNPNNWYFGIMPWCGDLDFIFGFDKDTLAAETPFNFIISYTIPSSSSYWQSREGEDLKIWNDIIDKPEFADVATSGSYNDLSNKPVIPVLEWENIENRPTKVSQFTNDSGYQTEEEVQELIDTHVGTVYHPKGSVPTVADLPDNANEGDVYNVEENGINYAWTGEEWDALSGTVDLSAYATKAELSAVATSGDYNDLSNKPRVPSIVSESNHHWIGFYTGEKIEFEEGQSDYAIQPYDSSGQPLTPITWDKINISDYYTKDETNTAIQDAVENAGFLKRVDLTQEEYDALPEKDPFVVYVVSDSPAPPVQEHIKVQFVWPDNTPIEGLAFELYDHGGGMLENFATALDTFEYTCFTIKDPDESYTLTYIGSPEYTTTIYPTADGFGVEVSQVQPQPTDGQAYFVVSEDGLTGTFFRSNETYQNESVGTFRDIYGNSYQGTVYHEIESDDGWRVPEAKRDAITSIVIAENQVIAPKNCEDMFGSCANLESLDITNFDTSGVTNMSHMFFECNSLTSLDITSLDTSNVIYMVGMFYGCSSLTSLDVTNFNTSNVTTMNDMFYACSSLTSLDVTNFNTSKVTDMIYMFYHCRSLTTIYANDWYDSSRTVYSSGMFYNCTSLPGYAPNQTDWEKALIQPDGYFTLKEANNG